VARPLHQPDREFQPIADMTLIAWLLVLAVVLYVAALALMYAFQHRLMYFPDARRLAPALAGLPQAEEIALASSDGEKLLAWHVPPRERKPVVIYFQGNTGGLDLRAGRFAWLIEDGTGLVALNYRGYGGSSGRPGEQGFIRDAIAAYNFAAARYGPQRIVLFGESLGTAVATALAAEHEVGGLILDAPFTSAGDVGAAVYPFAPVRRLIKDNFRSDQRIGRVRAPVLVLHGELDRVVPLRLGEALFALANEPKQMLRFPAGGHVNLDDHGAVDAVKRFLAGLHGAE
jgi:fermentation-respiration switch protein FrsA (DUF1100 family)